MCLKLHKQLTYAFCKIIFSCQKSNNRIYIWQFIKNFIVGEGVCVFTDKVAVFCSHKELFFYFCSIFCEHGKCFACEALQPQYFMFKKSFVIRKTVDVTIHPLAVFLLCTEHFSKDLLGFNKFCVPGSKDLFWPSNLKKILLWYWLADFIPLWNYGHNVSTLWSETAKGLIYFAFNPSLIYVDSLLFIQVDSLPECFAVWPSFEKNVAQHDEESFHAGISWWQSVKEHLIFYTRCNL